MTVTSEPLQKTLSLPPVSYSYIPLHPLCLGNSYKSYTQGLTSGLCGMSFPMFIPLQFLYILNFPRLGGPSISYEEKCLTKANIAEKTLSVFSIWIIDQYLNARNFCYRCTIVDKVNGYLKMKFYIFYVLKNHTQYG